MPWLVHFTGNKVGRLMEAVIGSLAPRSSSFFWFAFSNRHLPSKSLLIDDSLDSLSVDEEQAPMDSSVRHTTVKE
jgi:hypothetical protein